MRDREKESDGGRETERERDRERERERVKDMQCNHLLLHRGKDLLSESRDSTCFPPAQHVVNNSPPRAPRSCPRPTALHNGPLVSL